MEKLIIEVDMQADDFICKADLFIEKIKQITEAVQLLTEAVQSLKKNCEATGIMKTNQDKKGE